MTTESDGRMHSAAARLVKLGLAEPEKAAARLSEFPRLQSHPQFIDELSLAADPDVALATTLDWFADVDERFGLAAQVGTCGDFGAQHVARRDGRDFFGKPIEDQLRLRTFAATRRPE